MLILLVGGLIGVFFIILLRRPLCVESDLPFPESVASAEVVRAGAEGSSAPKYVFGAMGFAGLLQILKTDKGLQIFREYVEGFLAFPRSVVHHFDFQKKPIGDVTHFGRHLLVHSESLAGADGDRLHYRPGAGLDQRFGRRAGVVDSHPAAAVLRSGPAGAARRRAQAAGWDVTAYSVWYNIVRPIAVGTMLVGACHTLFGMRTSIIAVDRRGAGRLGARGAGRATLRAHRSRHSRSSGWRSAPSC